ncbi:MAG: hypothetical protein ACHWZW_23500 [Spirulina sp.]
MIRLQQLKRQRVGLILGGVGLLWGLGSLATAGLAQEVAGLVPDKPTDLALAETKQTAAQRYTNAMLVGYAAAEQGDYHTALINFRRALAARPGDRYALAAIRNMESYIAMQRAEAAKRAEIARLETTVAAAVAASDWACAAASVDRLVELVPPTSPDRSRLIAYRGELAGMIASRDNLDSWSTVCPGGQI